VTALCRFTAQGDFMPSSSFRTTSDGTPRMVEVAGATARGSSYREAKGGAFDFLFITKTPYAPSQTSNCPSATMESTCVPGPGCARLPRRTSKLPQPHW
jgi:hypothetical protein